MITVMQRLIVLQLAEKMQWRWHVHAIIQYNADTLSVVLTKK